MFFKLGRGTVEACLIAENMGRLVSAVADLRPFAPSLLPQLKRIAEEVAVQNSVFGCFDVFLLHFEIELNRLTIPSSHHRHSSHHHFCRLLAYEDPDVRAVAFRAHGALSEVALADRSGGVRKELNSSNLKRPYPQNGSFGIVDRGIFTKRT